MVFYSQIDGLSESAIQTLEDMLKIVCLNSRVIGMIICLIEFAHQNIYHSSIGIAPFEFLSGRKYR